MHKLLDLSQKVLMAILLGESHKIVHKAWQDDTNKGFLICYKINLILEGNERYMVKPCEVNIEGQYPSLGLELDVDVNKHLMSMLNIKSLPQRISHVVQHDHLGEV